MGNEAVDQLTKFNQALADHSNMEKPRLIDGIVLTKFDTIDDKVIYVYCISFNPVICLLMLAVHVFLAIIVING